MVLKLNKKALVKISMVCILKKVHGINNERENKVKVV
jgi:hypothetical protein